ncbi:MAG: DUF6879 family protein [Micromonosporaceae bacterium]
MGRPLNDDEWWQFFTEIEYTAFRLELQPEYRVADEQESFQRFLAGEPAMPEDVDGGDEWFSLVRDLTKRGGRMERVRVQEDPPTDYQRWERAWGRWNAEAGERIWYITRQQAHDVGLLPAAGNVDWWLFDSHKLVQMHFDSDGNRGRTELVSDPDAVVRANVWRDTALYHAQRIGTLGTVEEVREQAG